MRAARSVLSYSIIRLWLTVVALVPSHTYQNFSRRGQVTETPQALKIGRLCYRNLFWQWPFPQGRRIPTYRRSIVRKTLN